MTLLLSDVMATMNPRLRDIAIYLASHRNRSQIDPLDIGADLLPHFYILEIRQRADRLAPALHIRLVGTALDQALGRSVKGHDLDAFLHGPRSVDVLAGFQRAALDQVALWMRQVVAIANKAPRFVEGVAVPVAPGLICGGLIFGEFSISDVPSSFESCVLDMPA
jgi:hypothetical protein